MHPFSQRSTRSHSSLRTQMLRAVTARLLSGSLIPLRFISRSIVDGARPRAFPILDIESLRSIDFSMISRSL